MASPTKVRSQPKLPLKTMSESVAMQWQGLVLMLMAHIITWVSRDYAQPALPFVGCIPLESWLRLSLGPAPRRGGTVELVLVAGLRMNQL